MEIFSVQEMKDLEIQANASGLSFDRMMQNAGMGLASWVINNFPVHKWQKVFALIGSGKNGSDTLIALSELCRHGYYCIAFLARKRQPDNISRDFELSGGSILSDLETIKGIFSNRTIVLDGIIGTGFKPPMDDELQAQMSRVNQAILIHPESTKVIAVDCPSGVDADLGSVSSATITANYTACMGGVKAGLLKTPAINYCGEFIHIAIGIPQDLLNTRVYKSKMVDREFARSLFLPRNPTAHKGTFGKCVVFAGSRRYPGAAYLASKAAYLTGAGLVALVTEDIVQQLVAARVPEVIWLSDTYGELKNELSSYNSYLVGPGLDHTPDSAQRFASALDIFKTHSSQHKKRLILDADGLRLLAMKKDWWLDLPPDAILTPHPGEMAELTGLSIEEIQAKRWECAKLYAQKWQKVIVLKGAPTVIADPAQNLAVIPIVTAALATAGTGDVLAGVIAGLCAQEYDAFNACMLGAYIHANAGLLIEQHYHQTYSSNASEVLDFLPASITETLK